MKIITSKMTPSTKEMAGILKREFSDRYSYKLFGLSNDKSIIVWKSTFVGTQISKRENEITIEGIYPSITTSYFSVLTNIILGGGIPLFHSSWRKLEKEIGAFLKQKYN